jgi:hypothetical protein
MKSTLFSRNAAILGGIALILSACGAPPARHTIQISEKAMRALPANQDLTQVRKRDDGCYFIVVPDNMSGKIRPVKGPDGQLVCDE